MKDLTAVGIHGQTLPTGLCGISQSGAGHGASSRRGSISSDCTLAGQKPGAGHDTVEAKVVPRVVMSSAAHSLPKQL